MNALGVMLRILTGKASLTIADQGVVSAANFLTSVIVGRICTKDEFGLYGLGFILVVLCTNMQLALITSAYTVYSPQLTGKDHARYSGSVLVHQFVLAMVAVLVLGGAAWFGLGPAGLPNVLMTLTAVIFFIMLKEFARQICFANLWTKSALAFDAGVSILQIGGLLALAKLGGLSAGRSFGVMGMAAGVVVLIWFLAVRRHFALAREQVLPDYRKNWNFCKWIFAYNLAYIASNQLYPWLLVGFHGTEANGVYNACANVVFVANPLIIGLGNFLGPKTAHAFNRGGAAELHRTVIIADVFFLVTMILYCVGLFFFGDWLLAFLFAGKYTGQGAVLQLLALGQLMWALTVPSNFALNAMERSDVSFKSLLLALMVMVTLGVWFVNIWGPAGVAGGLLTGYAVACVYTRIVFRKQIRFFKTQHATLLCSNRP